MNASAPNKIHGSYKSCVLMLILCSYQNSQECKRAAQTKHEGAELCIRQQLGSPAANSPERGCTTKQESPKKRHRKDMGRSRRPPPPFPPLPSPSLPPPPPLPRPQDPPTTSLPHLLPKNSPVPSLSLPPPPPLEKHQHGLPAPLCLPRPLFPNPSRNASNTWVTIPFRAQWPSRCAKGSAKARRSWQRTCRCRSLGAPPCAA